MLSIVVEASCNRYNRAECVDCHVYEPLAHLPKSEWHLTPDRAQTMADTIRKVDTLYTLAQHEINLTGGEASMNPYIVDVFKIFRVLTPNVCLHTNLEINTTQSKRWKNLAEIIRLQGRIDITLYPSAWERFQKPLLKELLRLQNRLLVNVIYETIPNLKEQIDLLLNFFISQGSGYLHVTGLLEQYQDRVSRLLATDPGCGETFFADRMGGLDDFAHKKEFDFGINILPGFKVDGKGRRRMASMPFPNDSYLIHCPASRGSIEIMTVRENGDMTPCCDVGNLQCQPKFGNLLKDSPEQILAQFEASRQIMASGIQKNRDHLKNGHAGEWVAEGIPPYCS